MHNMLVALAGNREMLRTHSELTERIRIIRRLDFIEPARIRAAFDATNTTRSCGRCWRGALATRKCSSARTSPRRGRRSGT